MSVDEMAELLGFPISPDRTYDTSAGFALAELGRLPRVGDVFDSMGWRFEVVDLDGRRIDKILAKRIASGRRRVSA
jgi:putative hemolysin